MNAHAMKPPSRLLFALELRAFPELGGFVASLPLLTALAPRGDGHPVLVLPGLVTSDRSTVPLRSFLKGRGYATYGWALGRNYGPLPGFEQKMLDRVKKLADKHGRKVSLVGWSLGGIYARQLAKMLPDEVRGVITLGSPFNGDPRATNAWKLYEFTSGHKVDDRERHMGGAISDSPPVPTTAIFSRSDGICAWQNCVENDLPHTESIEVEASHCGLGHHPAVVYAVADRLAQPEGQWKKFDRSGFKALFYPDPKRA
ncbi:esterase/lipase family protein [Mesorhizobium sp. ZC-5]|uniref:esterase/lipase family protein n=1 Tax=Mesorhizobium sp. ZC-5 TaxID=2986066 RepID=UPI0021E70D15|nr:alpha/beta hydrolase [Mesorhizobium sp. ZC-5]MCV3240807.1 alpha/beta hydrolase [Mesorhizobium sp. ZC-5]